MTTPLYPTLADEQLTEAASALPSDRLLLIFKGPTLQAAKQAAAENFIENPEAWSCRAWMCGEWTLGYEIRT